MHKPMDTREKGKGASRTREHLVNGICGTRFSSERGSQMRLSRLVASVVFVVALGSAAMADGFDPSLLEYQGAFKTGSRYAGTGLAYDPSGDGGNGTLLTNGTGGGTWLYSHRMDAAPKITGDASALNKATQVFRNAWQSGTAGGGMDCVGDKVYGVSSDGSHNGKAGYSNLDGSAPAGYGGTWRLNPNPGRRIEDHVSLVPQNWVTTVLAPRGYGDYFLSCGGDWSQYGGGPAMHVYDADTPVDHDTNPGTPDVLPAKTLMSYSTGSPVPGWDTDDRWNGSAWVEMGDQTYFLLTGRKDVGGGTFEATILVYDAQDFVDVLDGVKQVDDPAPIYTISVQDKMFGSDDQLGGAVYLPDSGLLYSMISKGGSDHIVHVWKINQPKPDTIPEPAGLGLIGLALLGLKKKRS